MEEMNAGYFSKIKNWTTSLFSDKLVSSLDIIKLGICFGAGFLVGLIFKKSFKHVILHLLSLIICLSALNYFNIISINVTKIKMMLGLSEIEDWSQMTQFLAHQIKKHVLEIILSSIGIILGFKVG